MAGMGRLLGGWPSGSNVRIDGVYIPLPLLLVIQIYYGTCFLHRGSTEVTGWPTPAQRIIGDIAQADDDSHRGDSSASSTHFVMIVSAVSTQPGTVDRPVLPVLLHAPGPQRETLCSPLQVFVLLVPVRPGTCKTAVCAHAQLLFLVLLPLLLVLHLPRPHRVHGHGHGGGGIPDSRAAPLRR